MTAFLDYLYIKLKEAINLISNLDFLKEKELKLAFKRNLSHFIKTIMCIYCIAGIYSEYRYTIARDHTLILLRLRTIRLMLALQNRSFKSFLYYSSF